MSHSSPPHAGLKAGFAILVLGGLVAFYAVMLIGSSPFAAQAETEPCLAVTPLPFLVDRNSATGEMGNGPASEATISENGCVIAFTSLATNLVSGDTNNLRDIFVFDRSTGKTSRVNVGQNNLQANGESSYPSLSGDGRYVAFQSNATNIADRFDTNNSGDIFVHDRQLGVTTRITAGNNVSYFPAISVNGRFVAFKSKASNLVENDTNGIADVFMKDLVEQKINRVSVSSNGGEGKTLLCGGVFCEGFSFSPPALRSPRYVAFDFGSSLVENDTNEKDDVYFHQFGMGITERMSETAQGVQSDNTDSEYPAVTIDGRYVAFNSYGATAFPSSTAGGNIFVRDRTLGTLTFIDKAKTLAGPSLSADGRFIIYINEVKEYKEDPPDFWKTFTKNPIYALDRATGEKWLVNVNSAGEMANKESDLGHGRAISGNGTWTVFSSSATNFDPAVPPTNFHYHVYLTTTKLAF